MKKFFADFKNFIAKGNIMDLAIAVIIGGAFGKIVTSLVNDIIMPLITLALGKVSIADLKWVITPADVAAGITENALRYGLFLQSILDFLIIAFFIFLALRVIMTIKNNFEKLGGELHKMSDEHRKAFVQELKAQGKTRKEIKAAIIEREAQLAAEAKAEAERKKQEEEALKPEPPEKILADIRELLQQQNNAKSK